MSDAGALSSKASPATDRIVVNQKGYSQSDLVVKLDKLGLMSSGSRIIKRINDAQAMRQSVVSGALDIYASDIGKIRFRLIDEQADRISVIDPASHHWARRLKLRPNRHQTWFQFWVQAISQLVLRQELVIYRKRRSRADLAPELIVLMHDEWMQATDMDRFYYDVSVNTSGRVAMTGLTSARVADNDVIHIVGRTINGHEGVSTLTIGSDTLGLNAMMADFQAALVKGGTRPTGVVSVPDGFEDDDAFDRFRRQIASAIKDAVEAGEPLVLANDAKFEKVGLDAAAADLTNAKTQLARDTARLFRMPGYKLGLMEDLNKSNMDIMEKAYVDDALVPVCEMVEQAFTAVLLTEDEQLAGIRFQFDREMLYDRDPVARSEKIENRFKAGLIFADEARRLLSLDPLPEGQNHRSLPVNTAMVMEDGRVQIFTSQTDPRPDANDVAPADPAAQGSQRGLRLVS
jgi:HK97 family phage portal protein